MYSNGDIVKARVNPFLNHYAVYFKDAESEKLIHNTPLRNVVIDDWETFFVKRKLLSVSPSKISGISGQDLAVKYDRIKDRKYNIFTFDCEDMVENLTGNRLFLNQNVKYFLLITLMGILIYKFRQK